MWALDGGTFRGMEAPASPRGQPASPRPSLGLGLPDAAPQVAKDDEQRTEGLSHTASAGKGCDPTVCIYPRPLCLTLSPKSTGQCLLGHTADTLDV